MTVLLILLLAWVLIAVPVAVVLGKSIAHAARRDAELAESVRRHPAGSRWSA